MRRGFAIVVVLSLSACADGAADPTPTASTPGQHASSDDRATTPSTGPNAGASEAAFLAERLDAAIVELLPAAPGERPLLEWTPVDGAAWYAVTVRTADGQPYWTGISRDPSLHVGGEPALADEAPGPRVTGPMTWVVTAFDEDGGLVGVSNEGTLGP